MPQSIRNFHCRSKEAIAAFFNAGVKGDDIERQTGHDAMPTLYGVNHRLQGRGV